MCMLYHRLEVGREESVKSIVEVHRIRYETTAPQCTQHIAEACASYAARNPKLMEKIYTDDEV
jgi:hypothetical protein